MAEMQIQDFVGNFNYKVTIDNTEAGFSEVSGFEISMETAEYREGNGPITPYKVPGLIKYTDITLKHGVTKSMDLYNWIKECVEGKVTEKTVTISALGRDGKEVLATWEISKAFPVKYNVEPFKAVGKEVVIESMQLAHQGLKRTA